ncbi:polysaccharide pyruvyl transferase family protein [Leifsonia sp. Leaf264]|uniref:polysaccharide pyruvyl transferase family protein n=1 Tax=Leifsonia sp. Leaf264 TaxID=1736314 RepID=UPI0006F50089|nr:polysaccharide pyruvyl transferase family protein [Leifsonia sp. Leaf264]KQO95391.1 hypothetical protein ASF30_20450 [Leifsonia sp. Leaf264]
MSGRGAEPAQEGATIDIFVPGVGQYDNIGDIILRRQLIAWLKPLGRLHVYVGASPEGYAESLGVGDDDVVYRSFSAWYRAGLARAWDGTAHYVFKPGEIQLTLIGMKEHVVVLPLLALLRLRGGSVVRVGSGSRDLAPLPRLLMRPSIALSQITAWRDGTTAAYLGGEVMPDLAFGEGVGPSTDAAPEARDTLVVSMRSDRPEPGAAWIAGIRRFAAERGLRIEVVTQVLRDRQRSRDLAAALDADLADWDGSDHGGQEDALRAIYARTALAVSDRLHVLIAASTEGATPIALLVDGSGKIDRHFEAAGVSGVAVPASELSEDEIVTALSAALQRGPAVQESLADARLELARVRERVELLIGGVPAPVELVDA